MTHNQKYKKGVSPAHRKNGTSIPNRPEIGKSSKARDNGAHNRKEGRDCCFFEQNTKKSGTNRTAGKGESPKRDWEGRKKLDYL